MLKRTDPFIVHRTQTLPDNCVSACLAMVLNMDIDEVTKTFHTKYEMGDMEIWQFLDDANISYQRCLADERSLLDDKVYLLGVPSLNLVAHSHMIVAHTIPGGRWYLLDPAIGVSGRLAYGCFDPDEKPPKDIVQIRSYDPMYMISADVVRSRYKTFAC